MSNSHILIKVFLCGLLISTFSIVRAQNKCDSAVDETMQFIEKSHNLNLPDWGPYTKRYVGISHLPGDNEGIRFDLSVFPGYYRRKVDVPNVFHESGYHPWEISSDLGYFSFRHELEWKDKVYTDISYSKINENSRLVRLECVNNTDLEQAIVVHFMASLHFPPIKEYSLYTYLYPATVELPENALWKDALDYEDLQLAKKDPDYNLQYDGKLRGEIRENGFVNGSGIGRGFGQNAGDLVTYRFSLKKDINNAVIVFRFKMKEEESSSFDIKGIKKSEVTFIGNGDFDTIHVDAGRLLTGEHELHLIAKGGKPLQLDGFVILLWEKKDEIGFGKTEWNPVPEIIEGPVDNSKILKYEQVDDYYGIIWFHNQYQFRQFFTRDIDLILRNSTHSHGTVKFTGEGEGHFTNVFLRPIYLSPHSTKVVYGIICTGYSEHDVYEFLNESVHNSELFEKIYETQKANVVDLKSIPEGQKYQFSQHRMAATLMSNIVYPVYTRGSYIKHYPPGKRWDCLYTWDSGFIGIGLLPFSEKSAIENLNTYVTEPGWQSAFIHAGTPVPTQAYLFFEIWSKTQSKKLLEYFYPRIKQYYQFLAGNSGSSTTRNLKSNLLRTWDYFYNSGGWDDYPPQVHVHKERMEAYTTPVANTAHQIRMAKILKMAAQELNLGKDVTAYEKDIVMFGDALQKYSWDEKDEYFGFVLHDEHGIPKEIMRTEEGGNFNKGLGGCYPLVSGICTESQINVLLEHLKSDKQLWSSVGLTAVDQSASYYRNDGYWNGTVWMPHQWFFWKTMLDLGETDFARLIATTGLDIWKRETEATYNCFEHFDIETGRGAGWHQFSGLSTPVMSWYSAYFMPGNLTTGFDIWTRNRYFNKDNSSLSVDLVLYETKSGAKSSIIAVMNPDYDYEVLLNNKEIHFREFDKGCLSISIPLNKKKNNLKIVKIK